MRVVVDTGKSFTPPALIQYLAVSSDCRLQSGQWLRFDALGHPTYSCHVLSLCPYPSLREKHWMHAFSALSVEL